MTQALYAHMNIFCRNKTIHLKIPVDFQKMQNSQNDFEKKRAIRLSHPDVKHITKR
jgi:hypothetical protein